MGLPGGWMILALAVLLELFDESLGMKSSTFGWWIISFGLLLQVVAEVVEFLAGAMGAKVGGASKKGMFAALVGGMLGTIVGTFLIPIPIVGSLLGSILGSFVAAFWIEHNYLKNENAMKSAVGAAVGRAVGVLSKIGFSFGMIIIFGVSSLAHIII